MSRKQDEPRSPPPPFSPTENNTLLYNHRSYMPSPLNPTSPTSPPLSSPFARSPTYGRPSSHASAQIAHKMTSEDSNMHSPYPVPVASSSNGPIRSLTSATGSRGSMVLYRFVDSSSSSPVASSSRLAPPSKGNRDSSISHDGSAFSTDSKYPSGVSSPRGLVPYAYDPAFDEQEPPDEEDKLHDPNEKLPPKGGYPGFPWRGIANVSVLATLILALLFLFIFYPVWTFYHDRAINEAIDGNILINGTGQAPVLFQMPNLIDPETPDDAKSRPGFDGNEYTLVFSDEFNTEGRTFYPGDDPYWEAVDLWYGATADLEWYDPQQITTRDGHLVITMDSADTLQPNLTPGSTAPFTIAENHNLQYRSGMVQSWNKFCFSSGYIEVSVVLPGPDQQARGYWPGAWTMGNLARPGYPATTDGMWPYTYNSCDVGTFPNQTDADGLGPAAALHSDSSRAQYNFELSWLSGQRLSSCSCPGSDHPGPDVTRGRGAPEIDVFEAEKDKTYDIGHVVSQSCQFAPFSHDYVYDNSSTDKWQAFSYPTADGIPRTRANTYHGSAVQQSVSGITRLPPDMFQGSGQVFRKLGFEYWADPNNPQDGYVEWQVDTEPSHRVSALAVGPDTGDGGSGVGQRLIPEEPMSIVLNLGISQNWQDIDLTSMIFPAEFLIDYVRVYQRKDSVNYGCDPKDFPTLDYINAHLPAYQNINLTSWPYPKPRNSLYSGGC
ncbi:beta-glucan synthesis-associated [Pluteus cervinus]|uniref:Beta-glucan synthesis-associated n=1 Tax=Pluteus cervinus TaxID=181527 RepID=A0ACD3A4D7_9AGAR|nr:beta-glucan synthesis-associated [Pluteus cervinus]